MKHHRFRWLYAGSVVAVGGFLLSDVWFEVDYKFWANVSLAVMAILVNAFTVRYAFWSRWRSNDIGRIYFTKCVVLSMVLDQIVLASWWDTDYPGRQHLRFAIYAIGAVAYVPMFVSLVWHQRKDKKFRDDWGSVMPFPK